MVDTVARAQRLDLEGLQPYTGRPSRGGVAIVDHLRAVIAADPKVRYFDRTAATGLLLDEHGAVTGLEARDDRGHMQIDAKCTVLATGGFHANPDMLRQFMEIVISTG